LITGVTGQDEIGKILKNNNPELNFIPGQVIVEVDPEYFRPTEVDQLIGDASKAKEKLGWEPRYSLEKLIEEMITSDLSAARKEQLLKDEGYSVPNQFE
jgi:GDPmannose 4,6-dehydratase